MLYAFDAQASTATRVAVAAREALCCMHSTRKLLRLLVLMSDLEKRYAVCIRHASFYGYSC